MTDEQLALLYQRGDKNAWEELYERYKPVVRKISRRFFLTGGDAEDLVQEGMCGLFSAVNGYRDTGGSFGAYASACIRNKILDAVKKNNGDKIKAINNPYPIETAEKFAPGNPEDEVITQEGARELLKKMKEVLSGLELEALKMYIDGMSMSEISSALGVNLKSVDNALNRAKTKTRKLISAEE